VGWSLDRTLRARLPLQALEQAILSRQPPPGLVHHSDRGVQYACADYVRMLRDHQILSSMSRPGNPYDNATCKSFLKTLKQEEIYANNYQDLEHLLGGIGSFIERYYNQTRLHSALGNRSSVEFEKRDKHDRLEIVVWRHLRFASKTLVSKQVSRILPCPLLMDAGTRVDTGRLLGVGDEQSAVLQP
jgi:hypothetical protein